MDLKTAKLVIKLVSADEKMNERYTTFIRSPKDCFGVDYAPEDNACIKCLTLAELDGKREPVNVFCKEFFAEKVLIKESEKEEKGMKEIKEKEEKGMKEIKEKEEKGMKEKKAEKVVDTAEKKESRPKMLLRKFQGGLSLEQLLEDAELLAKYNNKKAWIKMDYAKIGKK